MLKIDWKLRGANRIQLDTEIQKFYQKKKKKKKKKSKRSNKPGLHPKNRIFLESERKIAVSFKRGIKKDTRVAFKRVYRLSLAFVVSRERAESCLVESHRGAVLVHVSLDWKWKTEYADFLITSFDSSKFLCLSFRSWL